MKKWELDVAVLCIFFVRPEQFRISFEQVKKVRPRVLLLWQDGPRDNHPEDIKNIKKCREIAEQIDWECEVYKMYNKKNLGCDPSTFYSHKWAFSIVEKCIILEDDVIASESFFRFCKELLDKYENDTRIDRICGQVLLNGIDNEDYSYFFAENGSSWGWASWRRVADTWDENYAFLDNEYCMDLIRHSHYSRTHDAYVEQCRYHKVEGVAHWEKIISFSMLMNSRMVIYPTVNLISSVGISENATHTTNNIKEIPKSLRVYYNTERSEIEFPLKHPPYIMKDYHYKEAISKVLSPSKPKIFFRKIESVFLKLISGNFKGLVKSMHKRVNFHG